MQSKRNMANSDVHVAMYKAIQLTNETIVSCLAFYLLKIYLLKISFSTPLSKSLGLLKRSPSFVHRKFLKKANTNNALCPLAHTWQSPETFVNLPILDSRKSVSSNYNFQFHVVVLVFNANIVKFRQFQAGMSCCILRNSSAFSRTRMYSMIF